MHRRGAADSRQVLAIAFLVAVGVVCAAYLLLLTRAGLATSPDSVAYVGAARNVANGRGVSLPFVPRSAEVRPADAVRFHRAAPMFEYPPAVPVAIGAATAAGFDAFTAAHLLNVICFGITGTLIAWGVLRLTSRSYLAACIATVLFATTGWLTSVYSFVASEALLLPLCLAALAVLAFYVTCPRWHLAVSFTTLAAAASLARFEGAAVIGTGVVSIAIWYPAELRLRTLRAISIGTVALIPALLWSLKDSFGGSSLAWHPPSALDGLVATLSAWVRGSTTVSASTMGLRRVLFLFCAAAIVVAVAVLHRSGKKFFDLESPADRMLLRVNGIFAVLYTAALFALTTLVVKAVPFGAKYLIAVLPPLLILSVAAAWRIIRTPSARSIQRGTAAAVIVLMVPVVIWRIDSARSIWHASFQTQSNARSRGLRAVPGTVFGMVRALSINDVVFTDAPDVVYLRTGRYAVTLPIGSSVWTGQRNVHYATDLASISSILCHHPGVVAVTAPPPSGLLPALEANGLRVTAHLIDGIILRPDRSACAVHS